MWVTCLASLLDLHNQISRETDNILQPTSTSNGAKQQFYSNSKIDFWLGTKYLSLFIRAHIEFQLVSINGWFQLCRGGFTFGNFAVQPLYWPNLHWFENYIGVDFVVAHFALAFFALLTFASTTLAFVQIWHWE